MILSDPLCFMDRWSSILTLRVLNAVVRLMSSWQQVKAEHSSERAEHSHLFAGGLVDSDDEEALGGA